MKTLVFIGNCQVEVYRQLLIESNILGWKILAIEVWKYKIYEFDDIFNEIKGADIIITQILSDYYGVLATNSLSKIVKNLLKIHNIYFRGYHPDCSYIGPMGGRIQSPIGDFHSQLVYNFWSEGKTIDECITSIDNYPVSKIKLIFEESELELKKREESVDVPISDIILEPEFGVRYFFSFNHPRVELCHIYLKRILQKLNLKFCINICEDPMLLYTQYPIYTGVRDAFNLKKTVNELIFIPSKSISETKLNLQQFCEFSYKIYEK